MDILEYQVKTLQMVEDSLKKFGELKVQNPDEPADLRLNSDYGEKETVEE